MDGRFVVLLLGAAFALALAIASTVWLFSQVRPAGLAVAGGLIWLAGLVALFPIPGHGTFMLLGPMLYRGWSEYSAQPVDRKPAVKADSRLGLPRFAGVLPFTPGVPLASDWSTVVEPTGKPAWLDPATGLVWSGWLSLGSRSGYPELTAAKERCALKDPAGYWALATTAEEALMWQSGGQTVMPRATTGAMSYSVDSQFNMELPSYQLNSPGSNDKPRGPVKTFSVRCVARSQAAPENGYTQSDIDLNLWNAYQLKGKLLGAPL